jgi:hypothetical protein
VTQFGKESEIFRVGLKFILVKMLRGEEYRKVEI